MEQLSSFLHRGSFVPPFPPAWLSLAKGQRLLGAPRKSPDLSLKHLGEWGWWLLGAEEKDARIQMRAAGCPPASLAPDTSCCQVPHTREIRLKLPPGIHRGSGAPALLQGLTGPHICSPHICALDLGSYQCSPGNAVRCVIHHRPLLT